MKSKELNFTENDKKSELLSLKVEENIEVAVIFDMLKTSHLKVQDIPNDYRQPYRAENAHEKGMGAIKETRTEAKLRNTASK